MCFGSRDWPIGAALLQFPGDRTTTESLTDGSAADWLPALREVSMAGFAHVDLTDSWVRPGDLSDAKLKELDAAAGDLGLSFSNVSVTRKSILDPDESVATSNLDYAMRTIDAAAALGIGSVCLGLHRPLNPAQQTAMWFWLADGAGDANDERTKALAATRFQRLGSYAAAVGVDLSLEMYEGTLLGTADGAVDLVRAIDLPNVGLCPDIGNIVRLHRPVEDWRSMLEKMLPYTNYWQVKNYYRDYDPATGAYFSAPAPMESGFIDYRAAIGMALDAGFVGAFCVEHYGGDGLSVSATNRDYIRRILAAKLGAHVTRDPATDSAAHHTNTQGAS